MRLSMFVCLFASAAVLAGHLPGSLGKWAVEYTQKDGSYSRRIGYVSKEACEAAIPKVLKEVNAYNGHCIEWQRNLPRVAGPRLGREAATVDSRIPVVVRMQVECVRCGHTEDETYEFISGTCEVLKCLAWLANCVS
jgi:hypothetical protein